MRTARTYAVVFWLLWLVIAAMLSRGGDRSDWVAIAASLGSYVVPVICYLWCKADSAARAARVPAGAIPLMAVLVPIGWAYYLFATRPLLRATAVVLGTVVAALGILAMAQVLLSAGQDVAT